MIPLKILLPLLFCSQVFFAQVRKVHGVVKDNSAALPGATVLIEGTNISTLADFDGNYTIKAAVTDFLVFTYVGMKPQRIRADHDEINVTLQTEEQKLEVVYPYISQKKPKYATTQLSAKDLKNASDPHYNFNLNAKNNLYLLYIPYYNALQKLDFDFQQKYKVSYVTSSSLDYSQKYNTLTLKYLTKKYKKEWLHEISKDVIRLEQSQN